MSFQPQKLSRTARWSGRDAAITSRTNREPNMLCKPLKALRTPLAACLAAAFAAWGPSADARVTRIIIDRPATPLAQGPTEPIAYETITGRAFGELDPMDSHNSIITDITLAPRNGNGMVEYIASFFIVKPVDIEYRPLRSVSPPMLSRSSWSAAM